MFLGNMYEPLLYANPPGSAEPFSPCLATSWEVSDDGMTWTFKLREGVTFHDGEPFNAAAVKYSVEATQEMDLGAAYIWYPVEKIKVIDDYTVEMQCSYPAALDRVATSMYGAWMFSPSTKGKDADWWNMPNEAGTGPYKLVSYAPNEETVFERYADYWGGWSEGQPETVVIKYVDEAATQRQMLEAGEVDFADGLSRDAIPAMQSNENLVILDIPSVQNMVVLFNTQNKPLDDVKVRQALSYAVNYEDILAVATNGFGEISRGPLPSGLYPYDPNTPQYTYDPAKAKQLLAEAGYPDGGFELAMTYASDDAFGSKLAPVLKENFADVGVTLDLQPLLFEQQLGQGQGTGQESPGPLRAGLVAGLPGRLRHPLLTLPYGGGATLEHGLLVEQGLRRHHRHRVQRGAGRSGEGPAALQQGTEDGRRRGSGAVPVRPGQPVRRAADAQAGRRGAQSQLHVGPLLLPHLEVTPTWGGGGGGMARRPPRSSDAAVPRRI